MKKRFKDLYTRENFFKPDKYNLDFWDKSFIIGLNTLLTFLTVCLFFENFTLSVVEFVKIILMLQTVTFIGFYQVRFKHKPVRNLLFSITLLFFIFSFFSYMAIPKFANINNELKLYRLPFLCFLLLYTGRQIFKLIFKRDPIVLGFHGMRIGENEYSIKHKVIFADYVWSFLGPLSVIPLIYLTLL